MSAFKHCPSQPGAAGHRGAPRALIPAKMMRALLRSQIDAPGNSIVHDPVWGILLDLFIAQREGGRLSVSDLGTGRNRSTTTVVRYVGILQTAGLVLRVPPQGDEEHTHVELTRTGSDAMESLLLPFAT